MNFIQSIFWDSKSGTYSASRIVMLGGFFLTFGISVVALYIVYDAYFHNKAIPDLSWLMYGGAGSGLTGVGAYGMNRWGTADNPVLDEPEYSKPIQVSEEKL